jgi:hypothetical protein
MNSRELTQVIDDVIKFAEDKNNYIWPDRHVEDKLKKQSCCILSDCLCSYSILVLDGHLWKRLRVQLLAGNRLDKATVHLLATAFGIKFDVNTDDSELTKLVSLLEFKGPISQ